MNYINPCQNCGNPSIDNVRAMLAQERAGDTVQSYGGSLCCLHVCRVYTVLPEKGKKLAFANGTPLLVYSALCCMVWCRHSQAIAMRTCTV